MSWLCPECRFGKKNEIIKGFCNDDYCWYCGYPTKVVSESHQTKDLKEAIFHHKFPNSSKQYDAWQEFAKITGGKLIEKKSAGWIFGHTDIKVITPVGSRWLTLFTTRSGSTNNLDYEENTYMCVCFRSKNRFEFTVRKAGILSKWRNANPITFVDPDFNSKFIIEEEYAEVARKLFSNTNVRNQVSLCLGEKKSSSFIWAGLGIYGNFGWGWGRLISAIVGEHGKETLNVLGYIHQGPIKESGPLIEFHRLLKMIMEQLQYLGYAQEVQLKILS